ncbi:Mg2+ and Co2+ transporter CorA [Bacillus sp. cl95]|nr:Mg2+ and Co2+ transporter CorA [Bacillus sp. UNCCL13]SFQ87067.1 Mg2+ and Co2+ transporter CorA [Bacillus sp. cl95]
MGLAGDEKMEHKFHDEEWKWYQLDDTETTKIVELAKQYSSLSLEEWKKDIDRRNTNFLKVDTSVREEEKVSGALVYQQNLGKKDDFEIFNFFITKTFFVTTGLNFSNEGMPVHSTLLKHMEYADNAIEGFAILLGEIMKRNLIKIDQFELRLNDLFWKVKEQNSTTILEEIYQCRHELLVAKHLMMPIREIKMSLDEAFGDSIVETMEYQRTCKRIDRGLMLIEGYEQEMDTLINLEEVVSSHRGNEIMKTLTVMTTLFTPVMAWGALWGMNFDHMPELKWKFGYLISLILIGGTTIALYMLLKKKGWFGDILKGKKRNTFFK